MDVTPQQLRDSDIKPAFRGYDTDVVNELLDRAAATIETQNEKIRLLTERLGHAQNDTGSHREIEDLLHKTLLLAQRTADEAIAEAQDKARAIVLEAESTARGLVAEAELEVRRITEVERRRIEEEIVDLANHRDALLADVGGLERWESDFRQRVIRQIEADLDAVRSRPVVAPSARPELSDGALPESLLRRDLPTQALLVDTGTTEVEPFAAPLVGSANEEPESSEVRAPAPPAGGEVRPSYLDEVLAPPSGAPASGAPASGRPASTVPASGAPADIDLEAEAGGRGADHPADLDDEAFFATLREAVRDDAPLGPRDESLFDQDREPSFREVFRRRR